MYDTVACTHYRFRQGTSGWASRINFRDMGSRLANQFQVPQSGIIGESVAEVS